ncbi:hypothetical protein [Streptomyces mirabilis]|uniref:hypothetical protein n=1 Tax=Streptomyces mirabilis TaxID=68239 RepID=UPI0022517E00|nr:hypothetical protein [Streptomyces mirabilis]MCX4419163.1 hypothetical protein [Streptomyces mirabilis]
MPAGLVRVGWPVLGVGAQARSDLVGELDHQPLAGDEVGRGRAGVLGLEQAGGVPQQVLADLGRTAQIVAVAAGGGPDEGGVQGAEALQVAAGAVAFDTVDVFAGPGIQLARQVPGEQRSEHHSRQRGLGGNAVAHRKQACEQADEGNSSGGKPQGPGDGGGPGVIADVARPQGA